MGHRVLPDDYKGDAIDEYSLVSGQALSISEFKRRLDLLNTFSQAGDPCELLKSTYKRNRYYITFDDGYTDNITHAGPILRHMNIKAIIFIVKDIFNDSNVVPWWDAFTSPEFAGNYFDEKMYSKRCILTKKSFKGLQTTCADDYFQSSKETHTTRYIHKQDEDWSDVFYLGNHTCSHPNLTQLGDDEITAELTNAHDWMSKFKNYLPIVAYPFGLSNRTVRNIIRDLDTTNVALATGGGNYDDRYNIRRINLNTPCYPLFYAECLNIFYFINKLKRRLS